MNIFITRIFSQFYPTASIRRIQKINDTSNDKEKRIEFDDKEYSGAKSFNTSKGQNYLFNLGKGQAKNNIITRSFDILRISEEEVKTEKGNLYFPPDSVQYVIHIQTVENPGGNLVVKYVKWQNDGVFPNVTKSVSFRGGSESNIGPISDWVFNRTLRLFSNGKEITLDGAYSIIADTTSESVTQLKKNSRCRRICCKNRSRI